MNVLVVCHFGLYKDFSFSFVHAQTREYVRLGHRVRAIVPIPIGKKDWNNRRFSFENQIKIIDGVEIILLRYFSISNYGIPISPVNAPKIFQRFYRLKSDAQGYGLGLSIALTIATNMNGRIWVESDGKAKNTFYIQFDGT